jgi:hypothetical protein
VVCLIGETASRSVECADSFESRFKLVLCNVFEGRFIFTVGVGRCVGIQYTGSFGIVSLLDWSLVINIDFIFLFPLHSSSKWEGVVYRLIQLGRRKGLLDMDLLRGRLLGLLFRDLLSVFISVLVDLCWCGGGGVALLLGGGSEER